MPHLCHVFPSSPYCGSMFAYPNFPPTTDCIRLPAAHGNPHPVCCLVPCPAGVACFLPNNLRLAEELGILDSHATWLVERWLPAFGEDGSRRLVEANNRVPCVSCSVPDGQRGDDALTSLKKAGCVF